MPKIYPPKKDDPVTTISIRSSVRERLIRLWQTDKNGEIKSWNDLLEGLMDFYYENGEVSA